jgi:hypothetical protein
MKNLYNDNSNINKNQDIYDSFNNFIFSKDKDIFNKLHSKMYFYEMTRHLHGDIVECGVFKGSGVMSWLKLLNLHEPHSIKKVVGFDFFSPNFVDDLKDEVDRETMRQVFKRVKNLKEEDVSREGIHNKIIAAGFDESKFELIEGDITETAPKAVREKPGMRISILNLDMDLMEPTYCALTNFWDNIVPGGVVLFDEYAYHSWSESEAADLFCDTYGVKLHKLNIKAPTAYIIKE